MPHVEEKIKSILGGRLPHEVTTDESEAIVARLREARRIRGLKVLSPNEPLVARRTQKPRVRPHAHACESCGAMQETCQVNPLALANEHGESSGCIEVKDFGYCAACLAVPDRVQPTARTVAVKIKLPRKSPRKRAESTKVLDTSTVVEIKSPPLEKTNA